MKLDDSKHFWVAGDQNGMPAVVDPRTATTLAVFTASKGGRASSEAALI